MMQQATKSKSSSDLRKQMDITLTYVKDQLTKYLIPFSSGPTLHELFVFDDVKSVRHHIMGAPRAVVHTALQNPNIYLQVMNATQQTSYRRTNKIFLVFAQCTCCTLDDPTQITPTLPDISIAFKLHLESGQMINLFDWLQVMFSTSSQHWPVLFIPNFFSLQAFNIIHQVDPDNQTNEIEPEIQ